MSVSSHRFARHILAAGIALAALSAPAAAQGPPDGDDLRWSLGLGVLSSPRPYVGAGNQTRVIPVLDLEYKRFYFRGVQAGYELVQGDLFSLDIVGRAQFAGYEEEDSGFLAGMEDRRETFEVGLAAAWDLGPYEIAATATADVLGRSDGVQAGLEVTWPKIFGRGAAGVFPSLGVVWQSADFIDYYAGVEAGEARPGRPAFEAGSGLNFVAGLRGFVTMTERVRFFGLVRVERLAEEFEESPIIDSRWGYFGLVGLTYQF